MQRHNNKKSISHNSDGFAVVEATFAFPIMFMIFLALVMLAFYLPQRAMLQRATQFAATAVATEMSDTWVYYDAESLQYRRYDDHAALRSGKGGVYVALFNSVFNNNTGGAETAETIIRNVDKKENLPMIANGGLNVECELKNYIVYKEIVVTATRSIKVPVDFSVIQFPDTIDLVVTSRAVVANGDEFIRNVDIAVDFIYWVADELDIDLKGIFSNISEAGENISGLFGV